MMAWHCDKDECATWQPIPQGSEDMPAGWVYVEHNDVAWHFCTIDCALVFLAQREDVQQW